MGTKKMFQPDILTGRILSDNEELPMMSTPFNSKAVLETPKVKSFAMDLVPKSWQRLMAEFPRYGIISTIADIEDDSAVAISIWGLQNSESQTPYVTNMIQHINEVWDPKESIYYWDIFGDVIAFPHKQLSPELFKKKMTESYYKYKNLPIEQRVKFYKISKAFGYA